jgi:signal transduction histidine kinase
MNEVDSILPSDMTHRLYQSDQKDEISRLVLTFNKLLDRIQHAFENQKLFLSNISHELKNPLNAILSQVEVALNKERPISEYQKVLTSVKEDVIEINDVTSKLMQLSKINSDSKNIKLEPFRIDEMVYQAKASVLKNNEQQTISLNVNNLPDNEEKLYFKGNEQLIKTALINILDNAVKYGKGHEVNIILTFEKNPIITIEDKGIGIEEKDLALIFEPFYRSDNSSNIKGSGIGLSLVKSIFDLHKISLKVESQKNKGTKFSIILPEQ